MFAPTAVTVIVNVWLAPTTLVAFDGEMAIDALAQSFVAAPLLVRPPAVVLPSVVRVTVADKLLLFTVMPEVADTVLVPVALDVMTTVHDCGLLPGP